ncbi:MAG: class I SAM-dependent methyltransferase, partial [Pseudomonadota bacterium]
GEPIDRYLLEQGFAVTGLDYSEPMLALARSRFPEATFIRQDMRDLTLEGHGFDAVISWDGFFHLTADEQLTLLSQLRRVLKRPGELFLTVGPEAGEVIGHVEGEAVYHASLAPEAYEAQLTRLGFSNARVYASETELEQRVLLTARIG